MEFDTDILVVGAGIQGAGVAQAAAAAGYRVTVLERTAVAVGTSSRSSKLIHGGLRYLETGQFGLVRKALAERDRLVANAPGLVHWLDFHIPVYRDTRRRPWQIRLGLSLYALLGGLRAGNRFHTLPRDAWPQLPLRREGLQKVFVYHDAQTDDRALTRAVMVSACRLGATLRCPARLLHAESSGAGIRARIGEEDGESRMHARVLVNAGGPWVNRVLENVFPRPVPLAIDLVQGAHILLDAPAPPGAIYVEAPQDRRAVFLLPWREHTLVGTTETAFCGDPDQVAPKPEEIDYLLAVYRHYVPGPAPSLRDAFAGLRVLPRQAGSFFQRPRDTLLHPGPERVLSLYGGKLTGYRATAEDVLKRIRPWLPRRTPVADTRTLPLGKPGR